MSDAADILRSGRLAALVCANGELAATRQSIDDVPDEIVAVLALDERRAQAFHLGALLGIVAILEGRAADVRPITFGVG